jgi:hypothetical protein
LKTRGPESSIQQAQILAQWGERNGALSRLEQARRIGDSGLIYLRNDPLLDPLRDDPPFASCSGVLASISLGNSCTLCLQLEHPRRIHHETSDDSRCTVGGISVARGLCQEGRARAARSGAARLPNRAAPEATPPADEQRRPTIRQTPNSRAATNQTGNLISVWVRCRRTAGSGRSTGAIAFRAARLSTGRAASPA